MGKEEVLQKLDELDRSVERTYRTRHLNNLTQMIMSSGGAAKQSDGDYSPKSNLKPKFEEGDEVYATYTQPQQNSWKQNDTESTWKPGVITSYTDELETGSQYGDKRTYCILYDSGIENYVDDYEVYSRKDYELFNRDRKWIGVRNVTDVNCNDLWAQKHGWYVATIEGRERSFSRLTGKSATWMVHYDVHVTLYIVFACTNTSPSSVLLCSCNESI